MKLPEVVQDTGQQSQEGNEISFNGRHPRVLS